MSNLAAKIANGEQRTQKRGSEIPRREFSIAAIDPRIAKWELNSEKAHIKDIVTVEGSSGRDKYDD